MEQCGRMKWRALDVFGVEVAFDLNEAMTDAETETFVTLFNTYDLLVLHGQNLSRERQIEIASLIGPLTKGPTDQHFVTNEDQSDLGAVIGLAYHSDFAWAPVPLTAISLHAVDVVDGATTTKFANAAKAYAGLPDTTKARLASLYADMVAPVASKLNLPAMELDPAEFPLHERRPAVKVNERTGRKYLLINQMQTPGLLDMPRNESSTLLQELFSHLYSPVNAFEHTWYRGDFLIWDNRNVQHGRRDTRGVGRRVLQRVSIGPHLSEHYPNMMRVRDFQARKAS